MRILHLISSNGFYGAESVLLNLAGLLKEDGHSPYVMCIKNSFKSDPEIHLRAQRNGLPSRIVSCRNRLDNKAFDNIKDFIRKEKIEIIHSHGYKSNLYGLVASRKAGIPIVGTLHGWTGEDNKIRIYEALDKWLIRKMNHLVAVSPKICEELAALKLNGTRATFIPNGIDVEKFDPDKVTADARKELGLEGALLIGSVGRLSREKGHLYLIKAFEKILSKVPNARLLIVGDGPLKNSLQSTVNSLQLKEKVIFTGKRDDLPHLYKAMDIFVLPSLKEGIPMALLEAMAMKLPVIASNVGGVSYVLNSGIDGILVEPSDVDALAEKILSISKDASLRNTMGERARFKIVEKFSNQTVYQSYLKVYKHTNYINS